MGTASVEDVAASVRALAHEGHGLEGFFARLRPILHRIAPFDGHCTMSLDPATWIDTTHYAGPEVAHLDGPAIAWNEQGEEDVNKIADLIRAPRRAGTLHGATGGDPLRSRRFRDLLAPAGFGHELRGAFVAPSGAWGSMVMLRAADAPPFSEREADRLHALGPELAEGVRRAILLDAARRAPQDELGPGLVVVGPEGDVELISAAGQRWLEEILDVHGDAPVPGIVWTVAHRAREVAQRGDALPAHAVAPSRSGGWLSVHGSLAEGPGGSRVAVVLQPARPAELAPLIARAHGLTDREREVALLVVRGLSTQQIAGRLHLSPYTVQDHLKAVFAKTGVSSRRQLVGQVFLQHFVPRYEAATPLAGDGFFAA